MNQQFHTPSFGDEMFEFNDTTTTDHNSKRMRNLDQSSSMDEYHDAINTTTNTSNLNICLTSTAQIAISGLPSSSSSTHAPQVETSQALKKQIAIVPPLSQSTATPSINGTHSSGVSEPAKPMSAYAFFFRDSMNAIKKQKPSCTFQEISAVVSKMWETLDDLQKSIYNERQELSRQEYIMASQNYRQKLDEQQQEQHQQESEVGASAAFTDPQPNSINAPESFVTNNINNNYNNTSELTPPIVSPTITAAPELPANANDVNSSTNEINSHTPQQIQLLTEAAATPKCTRENCNKPAIINPDWEDEYCSNECVIIHCRTVFSDWVKEMSKPTQTTSTTVGSSVGQGTST